MYESDYIKQMTRDANRLIEQEEQRKKLEKIYNENAGNMDTIEANYRLSEDEKAILKDIDSAEKHQAELDQAFLRGFSGGK